jgi:hypothetical protein
MSVESELIKQAEEIALSYQSRTAQIDRELAEMEAKKTQLKAEFHVTNLALKRLSRFVPIVGSDLQCPRCCANNKTGILHGTAHGTRHIDTFRCHTCNSEFELSF